MRKIIVAISVAMFGLSLFFPAILTEYSQDSAWGIQCLLLGWAAIFQMRFEWIANPLLVGGLVFLWKGRYLPTIGLGVMAMMLGSGTFGIRQLSPGEQLNPGTVTGFGIGFYLWLASLALPTIASFILLLTAEVDSSVGT